MFMIKILKKCFGQSVSESVIKTFVRWDLLILNKWIGVIPQRECLRVFFTEDMKMVVQWIACKTLMMYQL